MPKWLKTWWPIVIVTVPALWAAFTYFDQRYRDNKIEKQPAEAAASVSPPATVPSVTAQGGIAVGGSVTGSELRVEDSRN